MTPYSSTPARLTGKLISFIVPVHNEVKNIPLLLHEVQQVAKGGHYDYELIFVNDGSTDGSTAVIDMMADAHPEIRHIEFSRNFGKEAATTAGLHAARGDAAICFDADLQHPLKLIPEFIRKWEEGADVVVGVRRQSKSDGLVKRLGSYWFYKIINQISETQIVPQSTDYRLIDRAVLDQFNTFPERGRLTRGLIDWLGFKREYIAFDAAERQHGNPAYGIVRLTRLAINSFLSFSLFPLRLAMYLGIVIVLLSGALGSVMLYALFDTTDQFYFTGPAMLATAILFLVGVVLVCQGLLAFYIGQIYQEVQGRPLYVVRSRPNPVSSNPPRKKGRASESPVDARTLQALADSELSSVSRRK